MKITKSKLKQIIKEELAAAAQIRVPTSSHSLNDKGNVHEEEGDESNVVDDATPANNQHVDVILRELPKINHPVEYTKLLVAVLSWGVSGKIPQITTSLKAASQGDEAFYQALLRHLKLLKNKKGG